MGVAASGVDLDVVEGVLVVRFADHGTRARLLGLEATTAMDVRITVTDIVDVEIRKPGLRSDGLMVLHTEDTSYRIAFSRAQGRAVMELVSAHLQTPLRSRDLESDRAGGV